MIGSVLYLPRFFCPPANLVFHQTVERIHVGKKFGDIPRGIFIVRGENVVLLGEIVSRHNLVSLWFLKWSEGCKVRLSRHCYLYFLMSFTHCIDTVVRVGLDINGGKGPRARAYPS